MMKPAVILLAIALTAGNVLAQPADRPMRQGNKGPMAMMQKLDLTDAQQAQIRKLHVDFQKKQIQNQAKVRLARLDLGQMLQADKPDRAAIEKTIRDISSIETDTKLARVDQMLAIRAILTPEQLKMWKEQRMKGMGSMRQHMRMFRREEMGYLGDNMTPPEIGMSDMLPGMEPIDPPDVMMDDVDVSDVTAP